MVSRFQDNGLVVDLDEQLEGFVPQSQLPLPAGKSAEEVVEIGQKVAVKVLEVDPIHHRIIVAATEFLEKPAKAPETEAADEAEGADAGGEADAASGEATEDQPASEASQARADQGDEDDTSTSAPSAE